MKTQIPGLCPLSLIICLGGGTWYFQGVLLTYSLARFCKLFTRSFCCCCWVAHSCPTLCDPINCSTPGFPGLHYLLEFAQTQVLRINDIIQPSHPLSPLSSPLFNLSQNQGLFQWVLFRLGGQSIGASASASVLPVNIQDSFPLRLTGLISLLSKGLPRVFSSTTVQRHQFFGTQPFLLSCSHIHTRVLEKT